MSISDFWRKFREERAMGGRVEALGKEANSVMPGGSLVASKHLSVFRRIPAFRLALLFVSQREPKGHGFGLQIEVTLTLSDEGEVEADANVIDPDDPSTIYECLPVVRPRDATNVPKLGYFPSYSGMTPEQRGLYLEWLCDTSESIDVGYAFVYYYGLERHLLFGNFEAAIEEVLALRRVQINSSFQVYSGSALVHACVFRKRADTLKRLYTIPGFDYFGNSNLLAMHYSGEEIPPEILMRLAWSLPGVNRRYLKSNPDVYKERLGSILRERFGRESYPFADRFPLEMVDKVSFPLFANISLPPKLRAPALPNFLRHDPFVREFEAFFKDVHESVKAELRQRKK